MKNPFRRISNLESQVADLQAALATQTATNAALFTSLQNIEDGLIESSQLERIAKATEYLKSVEEHRQKNAGQKHEF